jgi:hypothetical protein
MGASRGRCVLGSLRVPADLAAAHSEALTRQLPRLVAFLATLPAYAGVLLVAAGTVLLLAGARWRRPIAALGGIAAGALAGLALSGAAGQLRISASTAVAAGAAGIGLLSTVFPPVFPLTLGAVLGGAIGTRLPLGSPTIGAAICALALGGAAVLGARPLAAGLAGLCGAALAVAGALTLAPALPGSGLVAHHPLVGIALVVVLGLAGAAAQLESAWGGARTKNEPKGNRRTPLEAPRARRVADGD